MKFKRARKAEEIEYRKEEILGIARELCFDRGVMNWSLNELGRRCSISKSNLYRYFVSREEVLMHLFAREMEAFVTGFDRKIDIRDLSIESFCKILAVHYTECSFFCELLSLGPSILEHNIDVESIVGIKRSMIALIQPHASTYLRVLKWLTVESAVQASQAIAIYVAGLWPIANPSETIREITKMSEFECIKFDFESQLIEFSSTLLLGYKNKT